MNLFKSNIIIIVLRSTTYYGKNNTIQFNVMVGELLLMLKGISRSHVTCTALCHFRTKPKTYSNCSTNYKLACKI